MIILGVVLVGVSVVSEIWVLIYGVPVLIIGIIIFLNKGEDDIEGIKIRGVKGMEKGGKR